MSGGDPQIEKKTFEMPRERGSASRFSLTVADIERSARYYEKVFGARILSLGDGGTRPATFSLRISG